MRTQMTRRSPEAHVYFLLLVTAGLVLSGLFHTIVFLISSTDWEGIVSWRKPIIFAFSFAITNGTLALVLHLLPGAPRRGWCLALGLGISSLAEVGLITLQQWRGVPSHFNAESPVDLAIVVVLAAFFLPLFLSILGVTVWSWRSLPQDSLFALGLKLGMGFLLLGQIAGVLTLLEGIDLLRHNAGKIEALYPAIHRYRIPHALALHAIQLLATLGALAGRIPGRAALGRSALILASLAILTAMGYALWRAS